MLFRSLRIAHAVANVGYLTGHEGPRACPPWCRQSRAGRHAVRAPWLSEVIGRKGEKACRFVEVVADRRPFHRRRDRVVSSGARTEATNTNAESAGNSGRRPMVHLAFAGHGLGPHFLRLPRARRGARPNRVFPGRRARPRARSMTVYADLRYPSSPMALPSRLESRVGCVSEDDGRPCGSGTSSLRTTPPSSKSGCALRARCCRGRTG